jgi:hypothetical protein
VSLLRLTSFRPLLTYILVAIVITYSLAALVAYVIDAGEWFVTSIWVFVAFGAAEWLLQLKRAVVTLLTYPLRNAAVRQQIVDNLREANMPTSFSNKGQAADYLKSVSANTAEPAEVRLTAALTFGELKQLKRLRPLTGRFVEKGLDAALLDYSNNAR